MKTCLRLLLPAISALLLMNCSEPAVLPQEPPSITFGSLPTVPAEGSDDTAVKVLVTNADGMEIRVDCDCEVVTSARYVAPEIRFSTSTNMTGGTREGWIEVSCGEVSQRITVRQSMLSVHTHSGWYEMPSMCRNSGDYEQPLIYFAHEKLPSDASKRNYTFCFAPDHYAALWVAYPLHECYTGSAKRTDAFGYDYVFAEYTSTLGFGNENMQSTVTGAYYSEYGNTGSTQYSRGHQLPSADRTASTDDNKTTFFATNMTPQLQSLNGGAWEKLEALVRETWMCADTLYVVTGAIFDKGHGHAYDNKSNGKRVSVPSHYYKVLLRTKNGASGKCVADCKADELQCIGFIFSHDTSRGSRKVYKTDACSVAELEARTGFEFFVNVPAAGKQTFDTSLWPGLE